MSSGIPTYVDAKMSAGSNSFGGQYVYLRPNYECFNKSRKVGGMRNEVWDKVYKTISKWYAPGINLYMVDGHIIGSNNEENALKEYWRVCDWDKRKQVFEVTLVDS